MKALREMRWLRPALVLGVATLLFGSAPLILGAGGDTAWALEVAALRVDESLSRARQLAIETGRGHAVVFDPERERFGIVDIDGVLARDAAGADAVVDLSALPGAHDVDLVSAVFGSVDPQAMVDTAGQVVLAGRVVLSCGDQQRVVEVSASGS
jgi:hypothetical protein